MRSGSALKSDPMGFNYGRSPRHLNLKHGLSAGALRSSPRVAPSTMCGLATSGCSDKESVTSGRSRRCRPRYE